jgi:hypothetical protein
MKLAEMADDSRATFGTLPLFTKGENVTYYTFLLPEHLCMGLLLKGTFHHKDYDTGTFASMEAV